MGAQRERSSLWLWCAIIWRSFCHMWGGAWGAALAIWGISMLIRCVYRDRSSWLVANATPDLQTALRTTTIVLMLCVMFGPLVWAFMAAAGAQRAPKPSSTRWNVGMGLLADGYGVWSALISYGSLAFLLLVLPSAIVATDVYLLVLLPLPWVWQRRMPRFCATFVQWARVYEGRG